MTTNIYILKLENNKYYVGKTDNLEKRKLEHDNGLASSWTKKYKPISFEKIIPNVSPYDEDKYTIEYMGIYGINNVRGGIYVKESLDSHERYSINKRLWGASDCCTQCGRKGHFVKKCTFTKDINGGDIYEYTDKNIWCCDHCDKEYENKVECEKHENICQNNKLIKTKSYSQKFNINKKETFNCQYCNKEFETQKGTTYHENIYCKNKGVLSIKETINKNNYPKGKGKGKSNLLIKEIFNCQYCNKNFDTQKGTTFHENFYCKKDNCYRCGRDGHYSSECYAKTNIDGYYIDSDSDSDYDSDSY